MSRFLDKKYDKLSPYVPGEQPQNITDMIKLNTNENPFPPSPKAIAAAKEKLEKLNLYSDPDCRILTEAIARHYNVDANCVIAGNGSDEILAFCFQAFCERGAIYNDITYGFYSVFADVYFKETCVVPLREDFRINVGDYVGLDGTVFIANPNAVTGAYLQPKEIESLVLQNPDRLVIVDEAYCDFGGETVAPLTKKYGNVVVVSTLSKSRSLAGGRVGFAIASAELIGDLNKIKFSFNPYNVNTLSIAAAAAAFDDEEYFKTNCLEVEKNREYLTARLLELGFRVVDSKANFILASAPNMTGKEYYEKLKQKGVIVRFLGGERIKDYVRITIGSRRQIDALLAATKSLLG